MLAGGANAWTDFMRSHFGDSEEKRETLTHLNALCPLLGVGHMTPIRW